MLISALLLAVVPAPLFPLSSTGVSLPTPTLGGVQGARHVDGDLVEVTYLANAGFLIRSGAVSVIIDGFATTPHGGYEGLTPEIKEMIAEARSPFDGSILGLVSHTHPDHFRARLAERFLRANKQASMGSSGSVLGALGRQAKDWEAIKRQTVAFKFAPNELLKTFSPPGVDMSVSLFQLPHVGDENKETDHLGHVIRFGNFKILHLGDMAVGDTRLKLLKLPERGIDLAFIPFWFYLSDEGIRIIDDTIQARYVVVYHMPTEQKSRFIEQLVLENPDTLYFKEPMERKMFDSRENAGTENR